MRARIHRCMNRDVRGCAHEIRISNNISNACAVKENIRGARRGRDVAQPTQCPHPRVAQHFAEHSCAVATSGTEFMLAVSCGQCTPLVVVPLHTSTPETATASVESASTSTKSAIMCSSSGCQLLERPASSTAARETVETVSSTKDRSTSSQETDSSVPL